MRLKESTLITVRLAPRIQTSGALGGMAEQFSDARTSLRASILPEPGSLEVQERGAVNRTHLRLLVPGDAAAKCGDGIFLAGEMWRILQVQKWSAHAELICEVIS